METETGTRTPRKVTQIRNAIKGTEKEIARHTKQIAKHEAALEAFAAPLELSRKMRALAEELLASLRDQLQRAQEE